MRGQRLVELDDAKWILDEHTDIDFKELTTTQQAKQNTSFEALQKYAQETHMPDAERVACERVLAEVAEQNKARHELAKQYEAEHKRITEEVDNEYSREARQRVKDEFDAIAEKYHNLPNGSKESKEMEGQLRKLQSQLSNWDSNREAEIEKREAASPIAKRFHELEEQSLQLPLKDLTPENLLTAYHLGRSGYFFQLGHKSDLLTRTYTQGRNDRNDGVNNSARLRTEADRLIAKEEFDKHIDELLKSMNDNAEQAQQIVYTLENWNKEFPNNRVNTPIGEVKLGENQFDKLASKERKDQLGMIKPTLERPDLIIVKEEPLESAERQSKILFIKTFKDWNGRYITHFESITVKKNGMEVSISNHIINPKKVRKEIIDGRSVYRKTSSADGSEWCLAKGQNDLPDLVPTQAENVHGKGSKNSGAGKGNGGKNAAGKESAIGKMVDVQLDSESVTGRVKGSKVAPKVDVTPFTGNDPTHPGMMGVHFEDGMAIASDAFSLIAVKADYPAEHEGKTIWIGKKPKKFKVDGKAAKYEPGEEIDARFPDWRRVLGFGAVGRGGLRGVRQLDVDVARATFEKASDIWSRVKSIATKKDSYAAVEIGDQLYSLPTIAKAFRAIKDLKNVRIYEAIVDNNNYARALNIEADGAYIMIAPLHDGREARYDFPISVLRDGRVCVNRDLFYDKSTAKINFGSKYDDAVTQRDKWRKLQKQHEDALARGEDRTYDIDGKEGTRKDVIAKIQELIDEEERKISKEKPRLDAALEAADEVERLAEEWGKSENVSEVKPTLDERHIVDINALPVEDLISVARGNGDAMTIREAQEILKERGVDWKPSSSDDENGAGNDSNVRFHIADGEESFNERQRAAEKNKGTVMPNLANVSLNVVDIPKHTYKGTGKQAKEQAILDAKRKFIINDTPKKLHYDNFGKKFDYTISGGSISESTNKIAIEKSDNIGIHISLLNHLDKVIGNSIEVEEHPDYLKGQDGKRDPENGTNNTRLVHRFYGAVKIDGKVYRVKTTMLENSLANNREYTYEVTKIEVLNDKTPSTTNGAGGRQLTSLPLAKLLHEVEKSYDKGVKILDASSKTTENGIFGHKADKTLDAGLKPLRNAVMKRVSKVLKKMGMRQLSDEEGRARATGLAHEVTEKEREGFVRYQKSMLDSLQKAANFIREGIKNGVSNKTYKIAIPNATLKKINQALQGTNISINEHYISINEIRHARKNHGVGGVKIESKSIPLTDADLELAPYIIAAPDWVENVGMRGDLWSLRFIKRLSNGVIVYVEKEIRNSPNAMQTANMWADLSVVADARKRNPGEHVRNVTDGTSNTPVISESDATKIRHDAELAIKSNKKTLEKKNDGEQQAHFYIGRKARENYEQRLSKAGYSEEEVKTQLDFLHELEQNKENDKLIKVAVSWLGKKGIQDVRDKINDIRKAIKVAERAGVDPTQYRSAQDVLDAFPEHTERVESTGRINPHDVKELHFAEKLGLGVEIFDVDDSREGQAAMRKIINTHWGEDANPWCLLQGDGHGELTERSWHFWNRYNGHPKRVAFKDGKLMAFDAAAGKEPLWWDRKDKEHYDINDIDTKIERETKEDGVIVEREVSATGKIIWETEAHPDGTRIERKAANKPYVASEKIYYPNGEREERRINEDGGTWAIKTDANGNEVWERSCNKNGELTMETVYHKNGYKRYQFENGERWLAAELQGDIDGAHVETYFYDPFYKYVQTPPFAKKISYNEHGLIKSEVEWEPGAKYYTVETYDYGREVTTKVRYDAQGNEVARLFMTEAGEVLGFVESKTWWIDLEKAGVDTPVHEWRHVWSYLYRRANPEAWKAQIELAKQSPLWDEVRKKYPHLKTESAIADEVMSHYDGARGAEILERDYQRLLKAGVGMNTAAKAVVWKHRVQALLLKGWNWIAKHLFRVKDKPFTSLEDAFKASFGDLMSGRVGYDKGDVIRFDKRGMAQIGGELFLESDFERDGKGNIKTDAEGRPIVKQSVLREIEQERNTIWDDAEKRGLIKKDEDGYYAVAPNGQRSNLTPHQWVETRTKRFKEWFGDWETANKAQQIFTKEPVASLTGNEFQRVKGKTLTELVGAYFDSIGNVANSKEYGRVVLDEQGAEDSFAHGIGRTKAIAFGAVKEVIENGVTIGSDVNHKGRGYDSHIVAAPIKIAGEDYICQVVITTKKGKNARFYLHEVTKIENLQDAVFVTNSVQRPSARQGDIAKVLQKLYSAKENSSKIVDENGEPLACYHYSDAVRAMFDREKARAHADIQGMFFFPHVDEYREYGPEETAVFLNIKNPADFATAYKGFSERQAQSREAGIEQREALQKQGYDGVVVVEDGEISEIIAFNSEQIKSATDNVGTYSHDTGDIRFSLREKPAQGNGENLQAMTKTEREAVKTSVARISESARSIAEEIGGRVVEHTREDIPDEARAKFGNEVPGWYDNDTGDVHIVPENCDGADALCGNFCTQTFYQSGECRVERKQVPRFRFCKQTSADVQSAGWCIE